jgi:hypothetical protein
MIHSVTATKNQRQDVIDYIKYHQFKRVVDIGGIMNPWAYLNIKDDIESYTVLDLQLPRSSGSIMGEKVTFIKADLDNCYSWQALDYDVNTYGSYDFAICTQCLEHVGNVKQALIKMSLIAKEGFIEVPNSTTELSKAVAFGDEGLDRCKISNHFCGMLPHKWIFTIHDDGCKDDPFYKLVAIPKLNYMEHDPHLFKMTKDRLPDTKEGLSFFWYQIITHWVVNDVCIDYPDPQKGIFFIRKTLSEGII